MVRLADSPRLHHLLSPAMRRAYLAFVIFAVTLLAYAPVRHYPFNVIDDYGYVVKNFYIQQLNWGTVTWSFTNFHWSYWAPLTWLSHALDIHFFGLDPGRHHETNLLFHAVSAVLLFSLLWRATGYMGRSFTVAVLFALHPTNVEAVAWIAERKSVLSMFFFLLALLSYRWYASAPRASRYMLVAALFTLGSMCKAQIITLPFVLLLWDYWPLGRIFPTGGESLPGVMPGHMVPGRSFFWLVIEKVPLLLLSAASAYVTMKAQLEGRTLNGLNSYPLTVRLGNAIVGYARYLGHAVWPANLGFFYPHAHTSLPAWQIAGALLLLLLLTWFALASGRRYLLVGWLWFLGTMVPMSGLIQAGNQAIADRHAYLPAIGLFIAVCWGVADELERWQPAKILVPAATIGVLLLLMFATRRQVGYWSDDLTLWRHTAAAVSNNALAENMIGEIVLQRGDPETAIAHFRAAAAMDPLFPFAQLHVGIYEEEHHHPREAIERLQKVIEITQRAADRMQVVRMAAFAHMSYAYSQLGDPENQQKYLTLAAQVSGQR